MASAGWQHCTLRLKGCSLVHLRRLVAGSSRRTHITLAGGSRPTAARKRMTDGKAIALPPTSYLIVDFIDRFKSIEIFD
jgi:hypothetical protein